MYSSQYQCPNCITPLTPCGCSAGGRAGRAARHLLLAAPPGRGRAEAAGRGAARAPPLARHWLPPPHGQLQALPLRGVHPAAGGRLPSLAWCRVSLVE